MTMTEADANKKPTTTTPVTQGRRRLVRALTTGSVAASALPLLPATWTKPLVDAVVLPAHAQLSVLPLTLTASEGTGPFTCGAGSETSEAFSDGTPGGAYTATITVNPPGDFFISAGNSAFGGNFGNGGEVNNVPGGLSFCGTGGVFTPGASGTATLTVTETATGRSGAIVYQIENP